MIYTTLLNSVSSLIESLPMHALALGTETIAQVKGDSGQCHVVLRDITKEFGKVWHVGLNYKILYLVLPTSIEKAFLRLSN